MQTRRVILILVTRAVQVLLFAGIAKAQASSFIDNFDAFGANRWSKGDHRLSRSYLDPTKVSVSNRKLQIKLPGSSLDGEELVSNGLQRLRFLKRPDEASLRVNLYHRLLSTRSLTTRARSTRILQRLLRENHVYHLRGWRSDQHRDRATTLRPRRAPQVALRLRAGSGTFYA